MKTKYNNESAFESDFCAILRDHGWQPLKLEGPKGWPDRTILSPFGEVFFFEFKNPNGGGRLSDAQKYWAEKLTQMDHYYVLVETVDQANDILFRILGADYAAYRMGTAPVPENSPELCENELLGFVTRTGSWQNVNHAVGDPEEDSGNSTEGTASPDMEGRE